MKSFVKKILTLTVAAATLIGATACNVTPGPADSDSGQESVNSEMVQLNVYNYDGGYKTEWLNKAKERYEELHKNDVYGNKKGVQIMVTPGKLSIDPSSVKKDKYDVYFAESLDYYTFTNQGAFLDISDVYLKDNPYEPGKKVIDKLNAVQTNYFNRDGKYYALPGYAGYFGIAYNIDLFDENGYYIKRNADFSDENNLDQYFTADDAEKSDGPDGKPNTQDDGLPVTYNEFFMLCRRMIETNVTPLVWSGLYSQKHLTGLMHSLVAEAEGEEQMMLTYTNKGTAKTLGNVVNGEFVKDSQTTEITTKNGYELARRKGNYDALTFLNELINGTVGDIHYYHDDSFKNGFSHTNAQETFLKDGIVNNNNKIGMLVDGAWWESEATDVFAGMQTANGEKYSKTNRRFGWMPLPKAEKDDKGVTLIEDMFSSVFVKSTIAEEKKAIAIDFLQFIHSDDELRQFTVVTNTPKALKYSLTDENKAQMSTYGKSLFELKDSSAVVYPLDTNSVFVNNQSLFKDYPTGGLYQSNVLGVGETKRTLVSNPAYAFHDYPNKYNPENYFNGLYDHLKNVKSALWK
mgnify:CR=1 FL=1